MNIENEYGNTPLHYACFFRLLRIIDALIDAGANITVQNRFSKVPLDFAGNHIYSYVVQRVKAAMMKGGSNRSLNNAGSAWQSQENLLEDIVDPSTIDLNRSM